MEGQEEEESLWGISAELMRSTAIMARNKRVFKAIQDAARQGRRMVDVHRSSVAEDDEELAQVLRLRRFTVTIDKVYVGIMW